MHPFSNLLDVLIIFLIPFGGGIPAGVMLAQKYGMHWSWMLILYFISDIILACAFEPLLMLVIHLGKNKPFFIRFTEIMKLSIQKMIALYGQSTGFIPLVLIAFGVDPMTGRTVAVAAGHGFIYGWFIAITGDMMYFSVLMVSTLWLNNLIGDGTITMIIMLALMMIMPNLIKKIKLKFTN